MLGRGVKGWVAGVGLFWFFGGLNDKGGEDEEEDEEDEGGERGGFLDPPDPSE